MKIHGNNFYNLSFGRALKSCEQKDFADTVGEAKKALQIDDGISMFKVFAQSLPQKDSENTGIGKINSHEAIDYLKFMTLYTGSNAVKIYPITQMPNKLRFNNYYCPYERFATTIGEDNINFFKLREEKYAKLLCDDELNRYAKLSDKKDTIDYENELDSAQGIDKKLLEIAYNNMLDKDSAKKIRQEFEEYKKSLKTDSLDRLAIVPFIKENNPDLFKNIENDKNKQAEFENYKQKYEKEIDIYKFGKFLALKNLKEAKETLEAQGIELYGDCPIGFSEDELIAFPDAFYPENITPGWGFRAPIYEDIAKENSPAQRLFKEKIGFYLENFDGIRFDVGWMYITPRLFEDDMPKKLDIKDDIIKFIEKTAKEIKGENYDTRKLMYECDAGADDFQMFDWQDGEPALLDKMRNVTPIVTTVYENAHGFGYGHPDFYKNAGLESFMIGTNNQDSTPLRMLAEDDFDDRGNEIVDLDPIREENVDALRKTLKLNPKYLRNPKNFVKAKFAQLFLAKNHFVFFNDVMGNKERTDAESSDPKNYRIKITNDYEREYHKALQQGYGFNLAESLRLAMRAKGADEIYPVLYQKICYYSKLLAQEGPTTRAEADELDFCC